MTVEHEQRSATNHRGAFEELVRLARQEGVTEYYVWRSDDADFTRYTAETVTESD